MLGEGGIPPAEIRVPCESATMRARTFRALGQHVEDGYFLDEAQRPLNELRDKSLVTEGQLPRDSLLKASVKLSDSYEIRYMPAVRTCLFKGSDIVSAPGSEGSLRVRVLFLAHSSIGQTSSSIVLGG